MVEPATAAFIVIIGVTIFNTFRDMYRTYNSTFFDSYTKRIFHPSEEPHYAFLFSVLQKAAESSPVIHSRVLLDDDAMMTRDIVCFESAKGGIFNRVWLRYDETTKDIWFLCRNNRVFEYQMSTLGLVDLRAVKVFY